MLTSSEDFHLLTFDVFSAGLTSGIGPEPMRKPLRTPRLRPGALRSGSACPPALTKAGLKGLCVAVLEVRVLYVFSFDGKDS